MTTSTEHCGSPWLDRPPVVRPTRAQAIAERFEDLSRHHRRELGVLWEVTQGCMLPGWVFHSFKRVAGAPKGNGRLAISGACELADEFRIDLRLWTIYKPLVPYYESFGFNTYELTKYGNYLMIREPISNKET